MVGYLFDAGGSVPGKPETHVLRRVRHPTNQVTKKIQFGTACTHLSFGKGHPAYPSPCRLTVEISGLRFSLQVRCFCDRMHTRTNRQACMVYMASWIAKIKHTQKERGRKHQCLKSEDINIAMGQTVLAFAAVCSRSRCKSSKCVRCSSVFSCASSVYFDSYSLPYINRRLIFTTVADRYDLLLRGDRSQITAVLTKRSRGSAEHAPSGQTRRRQHPDRTHVPPRTLSQHSNVAYNLCVS